MSLTTRFSPFTTPAPLPPDDVSEKRLRLLRGLADMPRNLIGPVVTTRCTIGSFLLNFRSTSLPGSEVAGEGPTSHRARSLMCCIRLSWA